MFATTLVLQPITGERLLHNADDGARIDINAKGFWENDRQCAFLVLGCLILSRTPIVLSLCPPATEYTNKKRKGPVINESEMKSMVVFHLSSSLYLVAWVQVQSGVQEAGIDDRHQA